ncbi:MAG: beta-glucosidase BglX [candidate division Zixibacteria bacterium]|nr:beta-glucosidase BglX [candidate division Zixibacteria bacterium]
METSEETAKESTTVEKKITKLIQQMTVDEKIGQLSLVNSIYGKISKSLKQTIADGKIGGILNEVDVNVVNELQRIAREESRLGIPLLVGRDVIHGFKTIFPIPLGLSSTWNTEIVKQCGRISAREASAAGINWTFAPMLDISRDPRWGRIAESFGEDPYLSCELAKAIISGFQGDDLRNPDCIAACAKHFAGYGASEGGKDYNTTNIPENELRNVYLRPFKAALDAGAVSVMTSFSDLNGIPASANVFLLKQILRHEWHFEGFVVSDWESISQLSVHGLTANNREAAYEAANAGVDMEMVSRTYADHLADLVREERISEDQIDIMVSNILRAKFRLGLFDTPLTKTDRAGNGKPHKHLEAAKQSATQSCVLLENRHGILPLSKKELSSIAVIGPLADDPYEQLGTWIFDGDRDLSQTPLNAIKAIVDDSTEIHFCRAMETTRSKTRKGFGEAIKVSEKSDLIILFLGEESVLSGEAHCRADLNMPGNQNELIDEIAKTGKPIILVIMAGRPLLLEEIRKKVDSILYAWHPGTMAGPAIADLLFGIESPSGKLPVTFPRAVGQIPIYYNHKNTGRPATDESIIKIDDIKPGTPQHSSGDTSFYLDIDNLPLYPFGYGLSYSEFKYSHLKLDKHRIKSGESIKINFDLTNTGRFEAEEVAQLYIRDLVGSVTRPVKELKGFKKVRLRAGETASISFELATDYLAFYGRDSKLITEPGKFHLWVGGCSDTDLCAEFEIIE